MRTTTILLATLLALNVHAQITLCVQYDEVKSERGQFYQYSRRYLNADNIIVENATQYRLVGISTMPATSPDITATLSYDDPQTLLVPLNEEALLAGSIQKMAECTAKLIFHLRDARMNLLAGEVEHVPSDGQAMQLTLNELNKQEEALTAEFIGKTSIHHHTEYVTLPALDEGKHVLARFSRIDGLLDKSDLSGDPILITVTNEYKQVLSDIQPKKNTTPRNYDSVLAQQTITISYNKQILYAQTHTY